ncbi:hypothetical protein KW869_02090 [Pseudomonas urmiensis]|uniref:Uncharacterized protein n=1 Tax=Pseudomonas urmiensis TaxID=2745493 RepID=A0ABW8NQQ1_9PSED
MALNKQQLIEWLAGGVRAPAWDVVVSLDQSTVNHVFAQEYVRRFAENTYFDPFSSDPEQSDDDDAIYLLHGALLDKPRLTFIKPEDSEGSIARLSMALLGGGDVGLTRRAERWLVHRVEWIKPLHAPLLTMDLKLDDTVIKVGDERRLLVDLSKSTNFQLVFGEDASVQKLHGKSFEDWFLGLDAEQQTFEFGQIALDLPDGFAPQTYRLRARADKEVEGQGAVEVFISSTGQESTELPGDNADFKYLLPSGVEAYTGTVLFHPMYALFVSLVESMARHSPAVTAYDLVYGADGIIQSFKLKNPELIVKDGMVEYEQAEDPPLPIYFHDLSMRVATGGEFSVFTDEKGGARLTWEVEGEVSFFKRDDFVQNGPFRFHKRVEGRLAGELPQFGFEFEVIDLDEYDYPWWTPIWVRLILAVTNMVVRQVIKGVMAQLSVPAVERLIKMSFGNNFLVGESPATANIAFLGWFSSHHELPRLDVEELIIMAGANHAFSVSNGVAIAKWEIEPLHQDDPNIGTIDAKTGRYTAPADAAFSGDFMRHRVKATTDAGVSGYALLTVVREALSLTPLAYHLGTEGSGVDLMAGTTEDASKLIWSFKDGDNAKGELSALSGAKVRYTAGTVETFHVDVVLVYDPKTKLTRETWLVSGNNFAPLYVTEVEEGNTEHSIHLTMSPTGVSTPTTWQLRFGPGQINPEGPTGVYTVDPKASEHFALIVGKSRDPELGVEVEGFILLPLPLTQYKTAYSKLLENKAAAASLGGH